MVIGITAVHEIIYCSLNLSYIEPIDDDCRSGYLGRTSSSRLVLAASLFRLEASGFHFAASAKAWAASSAAAVRIPVLPGSSAQLGLCEDGCLFLFGH